MTIITTEIQKWKRNKIVWCILALTLLLGAFAIERACSISRSSPFMDSFGDLYTLAFKNLSSLFLPIVLGMFATTLFFDEHKNDTMKELLIIPITKAQLYFSKVAVVILMSVGLCLITFLLCVVGGLIAGGFPDLNAQTLMDAGLLYLAGGILIPIAMLPIVFLSTLSKGYMLVTATASILTGILSGYIPFDSESVLYLLRKCMEISLLTAFAVLPVLAVAAAQKGYILPVCLTLIYTFLGFILLMVNMYLHPLSSMTAIVMYDIPGVVFDQPLNIPAAFLCIGVWAAASAVLANVALVRRK